MSDGPWTVDVSTKAARSLRGLPQAVRLRLFDALATLASAPHTAGVKKLVGERALWRIRVGDYRIVYRLNSADRIIEVVDVGHRRDIYRR